MNTVEETKVHSGTKKKKVIILAAIFALVILIIVGASLYGRIFKVSAVIGIDVNPSIEIEVGRNEKVREVEALNDEAKAVIADMDFEGTDLDVVINALIGSMIRYGYINEINNSVLVSIAGGNNARNELLRSKVEDEISEILRGFDVDGAVIGQTVGNDNRLKEKAEKYDISLGKAAFIQKIVDKDVSKDFSELTDASISELSLLAELKYADGFDKAGIVDQSGYIGEENALKAAFEDAGAVQDTVEYLRVHLDYEDGTVVYEIEFVSGGIEYEYEVRASDGFIMKKDAEIYDDISVMFPSNGGNSGSTAVDGEYIGESKAKEIVLTHAECTENQVSFTKFKLDHHHHGGAEYEIEFIFDGTEYEYEIDAASGKITDYHCERGEGHHHNFAPQTGSNTDYIGSERAKEIAFDDAGVVKPDFIEIDFDYDDGMAKYEIEFIDGDTEYEYEIDAVDGTIIKREYETN